MGAPLQIVDVSWGVLTQSMPPLPDIDRSTACGVGPVLGLGESSGSAALASRRAEYPWAEQMSRKMSRNV